jgi:hypothetical protein
VARRAILSQAQSLWKDRTTVAELEICRQTIADIGLDEYLEVLASGADIVMQVGAIVGRFPRGSAHDPTVVATLRSWTKEAGRIWPAASDRRPTGRTGRRPRRCAAPREQPDGGRRMLNAAARSQKLRCAKLEHGQT